MRLHNDQEMERMAISNEHSFPQPRGTSVIRDRSAHPEDQALPQAEAGQNIAMTQLGPPFTLVAPTSR